METLSLKTTRPSKALIPRARTFVAVTASTRTMLTGVSNYAVYHGQRTKALSSISSRASKSERETLRSTFRVAKTLVSLSLS